jgi:SAM-dependent methyltransferase
MFPELYRVHHDLHSEDLSFWIKLAAQCAEPMLELGCGAGRVLLPLARAGHRMLGVEQDAQMLAELRRQMDADLDLKARLSVVQADFTHLRLAQRFGLILVPCNTYSQLQDDARRETLHMARAHLQPGGRFAVAMPNPPMLLELPARSALQVEEIFAHPGDGEPVQVSSGWRRTHREFILDWRYDHLLPDGSVERCSVSIHHRLTPVQTLLQEFHQAGFDRIELLGDFEFAAYTPEADDLIIIAY